MLPGLARVEECSQTRGGVLPAVIGFLESIFAFFTQGSFCPQSQDWMDPRGGDDLEVEFRILGGGFQRFEEVGDGWGVSKWLA